MRVRDWRHRVRVKARSRGGTCEYVAGGKGLGSGRVDGVTRTHTRTQPTRPIPKTYTDVPRQRALSPTLCLQSRTHIRTTPSTRPDLNAVTPTTYTDVPRQRPLFLTLCLRPRTQTYPANAPYPLPSASSHVHTHVPPRQRALTPTPPNPNPLPSST